MLLDGINAIRACHHKEGHPHHHPHAGDAPVETHSHGGREIKVVRRVLDANDFMAGVNRKLFAEKQVFVLNLMSSPGSGKTTTLEKTLQHLMPEFRCAVIVGDICTTQDADRLAASGAPVVQINTDEFGGDCHLAAHVIEKALGGLDLDALDILIVENIGNLVCPASFDLGQHANVTLLSVTEGDDKPAKYPVMFRAADLVVLSKSDFLDVIDDFDPAKAERHVRELANPAPVFRLSVRRAETLAP